MRHGRGFTLIEVLVALAIVAIGMAAVLGTLTSSANTISYLRDKTFAQWVALNQIATLRISGQMTPVGNSDGNIDFAGRSWHWRREVIATQVPGVVRIDVKVRPADVKADEDNGWFTTVSGIQGDAVGVPNGYQPLWGGQVLPGFGNGQPSNRLGAPGAPGSGGLGAPGATGPGSLGAPGTTGSGGIGAPDTLGGGTGTTPTPPPSPPPLPGDQPPPDSSE
jgi:general secretion pathway protein I